MIKMTKFLNYLTRTVFKSFDFIEIEELCDNYKSKDFFFISIGANDGKRRDPIYNYVKKYHWSGILVEPIEEYYEMLKKNFVQHDNLLFENVAISDKSEERTIYTVPKENIENETIFGLLSSFYKENLTQKFKGDVVERVTKCVTLPHLIKKYNVNHIDLLLVDTEGHDYEVVRQIKKLKSLPKIIYYEHTYLKNKAECEQFLMDLGYKTDYKGPNVIAKYEK